MPIRDNDGADNPDSASGAHAPKMPLPSLAKVEGAHEALSVWVAPDQTNEVQVRNSPTDPDQWGILLAHAVLAVSANFTTTPRQKRAFILDTLQTMQIGIEELVLMEANQGS